MRIAIADDDPIVCQSLATILEATGTADVLWTANDGDETVRRYFASPSSRPDVLLADVQMPVRDGLDAAREILAKDPAARILVLTTFADKTYIDRAMAMGAKGYLIKQDVASVAPALNAVMAGQVVLGADVLGKLTSPATTAASAGHSDGHDPDPDPTGPHPTVTASAVIEPDGAMDAMLNDRERAIAALVAEGLDNRDIAARLFLSEGTVRNRVSAILDKLGLANRTQLAILWIREHR